jgi:hypothetical protein
MWSKSSLRVMGSRGCSTVATDVSIANSKACPTGTVYADVYVGHALSTANGPWCRNLQQAHAHSMTQ